MNAYYHSMSSVKKWGGNPEDYQPIHDFIDQSKNGIGDVRHRAILHHTVGTFIVEQTFGTTIINSDGKKIPTREIAERHIVEDVGFLPTPKDWLQCISLKAIPWAGGQGDKLAERGVPVSRNVVDKIKETRENRRNKNGDQ